MLNAGSKVFGVLFLFLIYFFNIVIFLFVVSAGTEQYSKYSGYAESYKWKSSHKDETPR